MPGSPDHEPHQEWRVPPKPQPESGGNPLAPLLREHHRGGERSHEEIVEIIRRDMAAYVAKRKPSQFDPVAWMREQFISARLDLWPVRRPEDVVPIHERPHAQLLMAWDLISQPYYKSAYRRGLAESGVKDDARHLGHTITLDPNESKLLSAMAEAVGIPNPFGQPPQEQKEGR